MVYQDLRPFQELLHGDAVWVILTVICLGAPLSEELLFRGFLFSGLAKSRLGLVGTAILTTLLWTALHAGYSLFGLIEVLGIGFYFSLAFGAHGQPVGHHLLPRRLQHGDRHRPGVCGPADGRLSAALNRTILSA